MIDDESLENLARHLQEASVEKFTGKVQINFCDGGITIITKEHTTKKTLEIRSLRSNFKI